MGFDPVSCGNRICRLRKKKGISQSFLADLTHISRSYMIMIEKGNRYAPVEVLTEIAEYFGVSMDYLIFGTERPSDREREILRAELQEIRYSLDKMENLL